MRHRWFYAVDIPIRNPGRPVTSEAAADGGESAPKPKSSTAMKFVPFSAQDSSRLENNYLNKCGTTVPVNEDYLFEVDVENRELRPVYWLGPIYEVRRGLWFTQEGSHLKPCDENLAIQTEEGYRLLCPWKAFPSARAKTDPTGAQERSSSPAPKSAPKSRAEALSHRLLGPHLSKYALYTSAKDAWIQSDDIYGKVASSVFQTLTQGAYLGGTRLIRGYHEKDKDKTKDPAASHPASEVRTADESGDARKAQTQDNGQNLEEVELELQMEVDYEVAEGETPDRKIDHLILCVHGIGQKLGERMEGVNFVHDVNVLRRNIKQTFASAEDLRYLVSEEPNGSKKEAKKHDSRTQVLPVTWRTAIQFGDTDILTNKQPKPKTPFLEQDIGSNAPHLEKERLPSLSDITVEGVAPVRNIISDVLLDILLYYQPTYREKMLETITIEMNRIYVLFKKRNPTFSGTVSLFGHSLGSALAFDLLCRQDKASDSKLKLEFDVTALWAIGSPIGLFQLLRGKSISALRDNDDEVLNSPIGEDAANTFAGDDITSVPTSKPKVGQIYNM